MASEKMSKIVESFLDMESGRPRDRRKTPFGSLAAQGQSIFVAPGDHGEYDSFVDDFYPAKVHSERLSAVPASLRMVLPAGGALKLHGVTVEKASVVERQAVYPYLQINDNRLTAV
jgi:hypothetical protein